MQQQIYVGLYGNRSGNNSLGKFAEEIASYLNELQDFNLTLLDNTSSEKLDVIVYASRSGSKLAEAAEVSNHLNAPLLVLSTGLEQELQTIKDSCDLRIIPNSSIEVQEYIDAVVAFQKKHNWPVEIVEYHQESKRDVSGTALDIASKIHSDPTLIVTIRNNKLAQDRFNLLDSDLSGYAIHQTTFTNPKNKTSVSHTIKVVGRQTYIDGLVATIQTLAGTDSKA